MKWTWICILAAFAIVFTVGFVNGRAFAVEPERLAGYIASQTTVEALPQGIGLVYAEGNKTYWTYDPVGKMGDFSSYEDLQRSVSINSVSAQSQLLMQWLGGGIAASISAKSMLDVLKKGGAKSKKKDLRFIALNLLITGSGYALGHSLGAGSLDYDSVEVMNALRDKEMVRRIKRNVIISAMARIQEDISEFPLDDSAGEKTSAGFKACRKGQSGINFACLFDNQDYKNGAARMGWANDVLNRTKRALSNEDAEIPDDAFSLVFVYSRDLHRLKSSPFDPLHNLANGKEGFTLKKSFQGLEYHGPIQQPNFAESYRQGMEMGMARRRAQQADEEHAARMRLLEAQAQAAEVQPAPSAPTPSEYYRAIYRCGAEGSTQYTAHPAPGCVVISVLP